MNVSLFFINLTLIFVVNVFFFFSGVFLNSLVIISFWRSAQLRKKLCYFMIMVLSCCDFLAVVACHPTAALIALLLLKKKLGTHIIPRWVETLGYQTNIFNGFSLLTLFVMNFDQFIWRHIIPSFTEQQ